MFRFHQTISHPSYYIFNANNIFENSFWKTCFIKPQIIIVSVPQSAITSEYHHTTYPAQITAAYLSTHL